MNARIEMERRIMVTIGLLVLREKLPVLTFCSTKVEMERRATFRAAEPAPVGGIRTIEQVEALLCSLFDPSVF